jgi:hypothetical protein
MRNIYADEFKKIKSIFDNHKGKFLAVVAVLLFITITIKYMNAMSEKYSSPDDFVYGELTSDSEFGSDVDSYSEYDSNYGYITSEQTNFEYTKYKPKTQTTATTYIPRKINLNTATYKDFAQLPGVDEVMANSMLEVRQKIGGKFSHPYELLYADGMTEELLSSLMEYIYI